LQQLHGQRQVQQARAEEDLQEVRQAWAEEGKQVLSWLLQLHG